MAKTVLRKNWYEIVAPDVFDNETVAETPAEEQDLVTGRTVKVNLKDLLPTSGKYYMDVFLQVNDVEGDKAHTALVGHETSHEYISRMISRQSDRIDYVGDVETRDGTTVRVKVVATTIKRTKSAKIDAVRATIDEAVKDYAAEHTFDELMLAIFQNDFQQVLKDEARQIYPIRDLEVRKTEVR